MAEKIELDIDLQKLQRDFEALSAEAKQFQSEATAAFNKVGASAKKAGDETKDAFNIGLAQGLADGLSDLRDEYKSLEASAKILKDALKNATDPSAVKLYADNIAKLEAGMRQLDAVAKKVGVSLGEIPKKTTELAKETADGITGLKSKFIDLNKQLATVKSALASATDKQKIIEYTAAVKVLNGEIDRTADEAKRAGVSLKEVNKSAGTGKEVFGELFGTFGKAALIAGAITAVAKFTASSVSLAAETEKATKQIEAFLGSADKAEGLTADLIALGKQKFIPTDDIIQAGKQMLGFGFATEEITSRLARISEISKGTGKDFNELATIYGKAKTSGTLYAEDINQLLEAGVNIIPEFAKQLGVSEDQVKKLGSEGKISFAELELAFFNLTKQGATFAGQSEAAAQTLSGQWDIFKQKVESASRSFGEFLKPALTSFLKSANEGLSSLGNAISGLFKTDEQKGIVQVGVEIVYDPVSGAAMEVPIYEAAKKATAEAEAEQKILEDAAKKARDRANAKAKKDAAGKAAKEAENAEKERAQLVLAAMREGEAKEIAQENFRNDELKKSLKKYHIDSSEAEAQHQINIGEIRLKYATQRLKEQQDLLNQELEIIRQFDENDKARFEKRDSDRAEQEKKKQESLQRIAQFDIDFANESFNQLELAAQREFYQKERSEAEIDKFEQQLAKKREVFELETQAKILRNQLEFNKDLTGQDIALIRSRIATINEEIAQINDGVGEQGPKKNILLDALGLSPEDADKVAQAAGDIVNSLRSVIQARIESAQVELDLANQKVKDTEAALKKEQELKDAGYANEVAARQKDLNDAQAAQRAALEEKKRAQKQELIIDTATQLSNTATAVSNIIKQYSSIPFVGVLLGIAAVGGLFAFLQSARARSKAINSQQFRKGGGGYVGSDGVIVGPSHESGGVVVPEYEGGEFFTSDGSRFAVVNRKMTKKHFGLLDAVNRDDKGAMKKYVDQLATRPRFTHAVSDSHSAPHGSFSVNSDITTLLEENNRLQRENLRLNKDRPTIIDRGREVEIMYPNGKTIRLRK